MKKIITLLIFTIAIAGCHFSSGVADNKDQGKTHAGFSTN